MANTAAWCTSFKRELACGIHAFGTTVARGATTPDVLKAALYYATASLGPGTTAYTAAGEATAGGYTAGGEIVTNAVEPATSGTTAYWTPSASIVYAGITQANVDSVLLYNSTQANRACGVFKFTAQTLVAGTLTLTMPANNATTGLWRLA